MKIIRGAIRLGLLCALGAAMLGGIAPPVARADEAPEYQVKAAFLYNFAKFVDWPSAAFSGENSPLIIGVLGDDPFGDALDKTVEGKTVNDRKIVVRRYKQADDAKSCHILYVSRSEKKQVDKDLDRLDKTNTLTVGDMDQFLQRGGMVNFIIEDKKVRLEINPDAAERANLKVSSKLLQVAHIVKPPRRN